MEAAGGFEPPSNGFADRRLNHLATPPFQPLVRGKTHELYPMCRRACQSDAARLPGAGRVLWPPELAPRCGASRCLGRARFENLDLDHLAPQLQGHEVRSVVVVHHERAVLVPVDVPHHGSRLDALDDGRVV